MEQQPQQEGESDGESVRMRFFTSREVAAHNLAQVRPF